MTPFCKYWITATLAPESVTVIRESNIGALLKITNESGSKSIILIEDTVYNRIVGMGNTYDECTSPISLTYSEACNAVAEILDLLHIQVTQ